MNEQTAPAVFTLIENGELYTPEVRGKESVWLVGDKVARVGTVDAQRLAKLDVPCEVIDASGCVVTPGFIDPHEHLAGAGGEQGFGSRTPEVDLEQLVQAGITTVVGLLGTDTTTRHLTSLLAKCRQLEAEGVTTYMYTGGFRLPTPTITASVMDDIVIVDKIIGVGEIAIADTRSLEPTVQELARVVSSAMVGGTLAGKAGVTHFHVGPSKQRLALLHELLERYDIEPKTLYPTHCERSTELMDEAIALAKRGAYVDIDTIEGDTGEWLTYYRDHDGPLDRLTVSSDAHAQGTTLRLYEQFVACVHDYDLPVEEVLPHFTHNTAQALTLTKKGGLEAGQAGDVLVMDRDSLELRHVIARGRVLMRDGVVVKPAE